MSILNKIRLGMRKNGEFSTVAAFRVPKTAKNNSAEVLVGTSVGRDGEMTALIFCRMKTMMYGFL